MTKTGKAWVMEAPGKMTLKEFPYPECQDDGMILKVEAVGVCGSDLNAYKGNAGTMHFPIVPGHEMAGTVEELGADYLNNFQIIGAKELKKGDRVIIGPGTKGCGKCETCLKYPDKPVLCQNRFVYGHSTCTQPPHFLGGFAQYIYLMPNSWVFKIPDDMSFELAAMAEPTCIALRVVERAMEPGTPSLGHGLGVGRSVVVIGVGPIGLLVTAVLKHMGAGNIICVDMSKDRLEMAKNMGADITIDGSLPLEERLDMVEKSNGGELADVVIETAGVPIAFKESLDYVRRGGIIIEAGHYTDGGEIPIRPYNICYKDCDIRGVWANHPIMFRDALNFLSRSQVDVEQLATHILSLEEGGQAFDLPGKPGVGKVIVKPWK